MPKEASSIKAVLSSIILEMSGEKKHKIDTVKDAWKQVLTGKENAHARPVALKSKRLIVNIDSSAWMYELSLKKQEIHKKLNEKLSSNKISINEIIFRIGEIG